MILGTYQPNGDHWQYVELASDTALTEKQMQGRNGEAGWPLPPTAADSEKGLTLGDYHESGGERGQQVLRRHALRLVHDLVVELERDALLYPWLNEDKGDSGNSLLVFGSKLHNAELALLLTEMLGLGWKGKRVVMAAPLTHAGLLVVGVDGCTAFIDGELVDKIPK